MAFGIAFFASIGAPETDLNRQIALIGNANVSPVLDCSTLFDVDLREYAHLSDNPNCVDGSHLLEVVYLLDCCEAEASILNRRVVIHFFNFRLLIKDYRVVVLDTRILLISHFDLTVGEKVDPILNESVLVVVRLVIEESGLDLRALTIDQFDVEERALASIILPRLLVMLLGNACLNLPVEEKRVQALNWCVTFGNTGSEMVLVKFGSHSRRKTGLAACRVVVSIDKATCSCSSRRNFAGVSAI